MGAFFVARSQSMKNSLSILEKEVIVYRIPPDCRVQNQQFYRLFRSHVWPSGHFHFSIMIWIDSLRLFMRNIMAIIKYEIWTSLEFSLMRKSIELQITTFCNETNWIEQKEWAVLSCKVSMSTFNEIECIDGSSSWFRFGQLIHAHILIALFVFLFFRFVCRLKNVASWWWIKRETAHLRVNIWLLDWTADWTLAKSFWRVLCSRADWIALRYGLSNGSHAFVGR